MMITRVIFVVVSLFCGAAHAGSLTMTLDGKAVSTVPVDRIPQVTFKVSAGAPYKQALKKVWGSLDHSLFVSAKSFKKGSPQPSATGSGDWANTRIETTGDDKAWGNNAGTTPKTSDAIRGMRFHSYTSEESVLLVVSYQRQYYTGKLILEKGKLVKEKAWQYAGDPLATLVINLAPPTFASKYDASTVVSAASAIANDPDPKNQYNESFAHRVTHQIMWPNSYSDTKGSFEDSKVSNLKANGAPLYNWNFVDGGGEFVTAQQPVTYSLHGKVTIRYGQIPKPEILEADFNCGASQVASQRPLSGAGAFAFKEIWVHSGEGKSCKTADGKSADDVMKTAKGPLAGIKEIVTNKQMTQEEQAAAMAKQMGYELPADGKEEETEAQKMRKQQLKELGQTE